jgi:hypothetical protein
VPIHFTIDHDRRIVEARAEGIVGRTDIEDFLDAVVVQNAIPYRKLFDGRKAIPKYVDADVMLIGARISAYAATMEPRGALALIAGDEESQEIARRFLNLGKPSGRPARVFLSEDEARRWLETQTEA